MYTFHVLFVIVCVCVARVRVHVCMRACVCVACARVRTRVLIAHVSQVGELEMRELTRTTKHGAYISTSDRRDDIFGAF